MFLLGIDDVFSDFLSELNIKFDFEQINFSEESESALVRGGKLKNLTPERVQEIAAPYLEKSLKLLWQTAKILLSESDLKVFKSLLKKALPILKKGDKKEVDAILNQLEAYIKKCLENYNDGLDELDDEFNNDSKLDALLIIAMLFFMSVRSKEASFFHKEYGQYFKPRTTKPKDNKKDDKNKLENPDSDNDPDPQKPSRRKRKR
ncbi:hypothetical protein A3735_27120 [Oleiphilus sp. HI0061]|uniref:hypothetical protein n=1 Tax=Oleiphilus sp. HI0061 TaxID=1822239 RepID=UPI0007CF7CA0|nr:hypothetical protein [Oleiphilus sp. HI0061]KZY62506.1 hypothetical protein A3735_27145 [Oleiphilus sp. HI0061]KZY62527.1 hypothetical protein A3735_27120 [Oleiphilus sp. HI0061]